ncbi:TPA: hypothetical protein QCR55_000942 [Bacillus cereus]|uniref:hypothetical protein n=1 Tax=unclassified Bacillus (in: firmicutes) TaxID=185979 RepID=UPI0022493F5E|nr:hypothetical protein [Bacillus sp. AS_3]MCW4652362.1 hypothetical protein [Bacillus sp. AS_3]MCX2700001.1 hypothetical protein [Bacillus sp. AS_5]HDR4864610.1 hypothetical protein [Bacillus cereus]HDR4877713.1 hypothetical protein [Bacillus cereus]
MENLKRFLRDKDNRDFIVALISGFTAVISVVIAGVSLYVAWQAKEIANLQIETAKAEKNPLIYFDMTYDEDDKGNFIGTNLVVSNEGGLLREFDVDLVTVLELGVSDFSKDKVKRTLKIPIRNYYDIGGKSGASQKKLMTYDNLFLKEGNNAKINRVIREFSENIESLKEEKEKKTGKAFLVGYPELRTYVKVWYKDIYNEKHTQYYNVDNFGATRIDDKRGKEELKIDDLSDKAVDLKDLDANKLLEIVKQDIRE